MLESRAFTTQLEHSVSDILIGFRTGRAISRLQLARHAGSSDEWMGPRSSHQGLTTRVVDMSSTKHAILLQAVMGSRRHGLEMLANRVVTAVDNLETGQDD